MRFIQKHFNIWAENAGDVVDPPLHEFDDGLGEVVHGEELEVWLEGDFGELGLGSFVDFGDGLFVGLTHIVLPRHSENVGSVAGFDSERFAENVG